MGEEGTSLLQHQTMADTNSINRCDGTTALQESACILCEVSLWSGIHPGTRLPPHLEEHSDAPRLKINGSFAFLLQHIADRRERFSVILRRLEISWLMLFTTFYDWPPQHLNISAKGHLVCQFILVENFTSRPSPSARCWISMEIAVEVPRYCACPRRTLSACCVSLNPFGFRLPLHPCSLIDKIKTILRLPR